MSDQSLREALEQKLATTDGWTVSNEFLLGLLAAHPVEPAPVEVVEQAARAMYADNEVGEWEDGELDTLLQYRRAARVAVEAAAPLLGPRPMPTREQVEDRVGRLTATNTSRDLIVNDIMALLNGGRVMTRLVRVVASLDISRANARY